MQESSATILDRKKRWLDDGCEIAIKGIHFRRSALGPTSVLLF